MTPWDVVHQAPLSMGFPRQEYYSGLLFPFPEDLPDPGIKPGFPALQADYLPSEPRGETLWLYITCQKRKRGNSLAIQQLGLCALIAEGLGLIPVSGTEIPQTMLHSQKTNKQKTPKLTDKKTRFMGPDHVRSSHDLTGSAKEFEQYSKCNRPLEGFKQMYYIIIFSLAMM